MAATRREFIIATTTALAATACSTSPTAPTVSAAATPLLSALRRDGYAVVEKTNLDGGTYLVINGRVPNIRVGAVLIGIDPNWSGPAKFNVGQYPVPDNLGYLLE